MDIKKILPKNGPPIEEVSKYIEKYKNELIVIKYGGNVFIDRNIFNNFIEDISLLNKLGLSIVVVHGGGPRIKRELDKSNIQSKFIRGLRVTDEKIINIVESVLIDFNVDIVSSLNNMGSQAISINTKQNNIIEVLPEAEELGFVGIPNKIDIDTIKLDDLNINNIGFIKVDIQFWEYYFLEGALETLIRNRPPLVLELCSRNQEEKIDAERCFELLKSIKYRETERIGKDVLIMFEGKV